MSVASVGLRPSRSRTWHSTVALGVFATTLGLLDGLHMALQVPRAGRPVIIMHILVGLLFYPIFIRLALLFTRRFPLDLGHWVRNGAVHVAIGLTLQYLHYLMMHTLLVTLVWPIFYPGRLFSSAVVAGISPQHFREYPIDLLAYWIVIGFVYASRYNSELSEREVLAAKLEASLAEARLEVLRRQLSPHFLFNTLNAISVLALRGDKDAVVDTLSSLSDLLRFAIDEHHPQTVPLAEELTFLEGYLGIQQVRFGERLIVEADIAPETLDALVPFMILQPIVENAIEHGTSECDGARIRIETTVEPNSILRLSVSDNGPGFDEQIAEEAFAYATSGASAGGSARRHVATHRGTSRVNGRTNGYANGYANGHANGHVNGHANGHANGHGNGHGNGIGLSNTRLRLDQLYGSRHAIEYGHSASGGASVAIRIPFESAPLHV